MNKVAGTACGRGIRSYAGCKSPSGQDDGQVGVPSCLIFVYSSTACARVAIYPPNSWFPCRVYPAAPRRPPKHENVRPPLLPSCTDERRPQLLAAGPSSNVTPPPPRIFGFSLCPRPILGLHTRLAGPLVGLSMLLLGWFDLFRFNLGDRSGVREVHPQTHGRRSSGHRRLRCAPR